MRAVVDKSELVAVTDKYNSPTTLALWMAEAQTEAIELNCGDEDRLRTKGDGPFIGENVLVSLRDRNLTYSVFSCLFYFITGIFRKKFVHPFCKIVMPLFGNFSSLFHTSLLCLKYYMQ